MATDPDAKRRAFRQAIWERDGGICGICIEPVGFADMDIDHIVPQVVGGTDEWGNLRASHATCNRRRGARDYPGTHQRPPVMATLGKLLRLPPDLHAQLAEWANDEDRSVNSLIVHLLRRAVAERRRA